MDEENFEQLLEQYIDDNEIEEKKRLEDEKYYYEKKASLDSHNDLSNLNEYTITIEEFIRDYLKMDVCKIEAKNLTHKNFKDLTKDNPLVIGIYNGYVDIDEVVKRDYILVTDCFGNIGSYLNPCALRDLTRLDIISKQLKLMSKIRITILSDLDRLYKEYNSALKEHEYLKLKCSNYYEMLKKANKTKTLKHIDSFIEHFGADFLNID